MASVLDLVRHYQQTIEKYPNDEHKILKAIDKLFNLTVTVQHLQDTGVGRTVNALRKEPGTVGQAARTLVNKWKRMVAEEESDQEGSTPNGYRNERETGEKTHQSKNGHDSYSSSSTKTDERDKQINGNHSGSKRRYSSEQDDEPENKKSRHSSENNKHGKKVHVKPEPKSDSSDQYSDSSHSDDSDSDSSESSEEEKRVHIKVKSERSDKSKPTSHSNHKDHKSESSSSKKSSEYSEKHSKHPSSNNSSEKSSSHDMSQSSHKHKSSKEKETNSDKRHKSEDKSNGKEKRHKTETKSSSKLSGSSEKHQSSSQKLDRSDKDKTSSDKHKSSKDSASEPYKQDKDKHKSSSEKENTVEICKSKERSSTKDKHSSSSKDKGKSKDRSSSSKERSKDSHKSDKKHSSESSKTSDRKREKSDSRSGEKTKHKSSSSSHKSKSKDDIPKKKPQSDNLENSDDGIDCGSGASFAEALGMISPAKPKKKSAIKDSVSPNNSASTDLSPAAMLAPTAKLASLPDIEISALPEISPHYKPRPPPKPLPHFDEGAMSAVLSSKTQRTKVYSGNKVLGKIPSLYEMCVQVLQEHIDALEFTGGVPYEILKPVVDRATPQQMFVLEHFNPYLMEDTDHLWQSFCEKHFRNKRRQEMETWREMYIRCQEEQEHRLKSLTANIKMATEAKKAPIKQTKMAYVDSIVKPPRNIARKQALHGTAHTASASPAARVASLSAASNVLKGGAVRPPPAPSAPASSFNKPKKAPLMQKALQLMRGRKR